MSDQSTTRPPRVLVTGATGYIGGRLLRRLDAAGYRVRCLARRPRTLRARLGQPMEVVRGDVLDPPSLATALAGVDAAYYLIHSMGAADGFEERDRQGAQNFAAAARDAGVGRIIYLGGLGSDDDRLSSHLRSRNEVGEILRASGVPTLEFRASIVLGRGSLSFEMIRSLVDRLPVMVTPSWVRVKAQPIAISDLLDYLQAGLDIDLPQSRVFEIGGADQVSYGELMSEYARQRGLKRFMLPVPVLTPWLSSLWLGLVTPLYARIGRKLIASIQNPTVVRDFSAREVFGLVTMDASEAIAAAIAEDEHAAAESVWFDALSSGGAVKTWAGSRLGNRVFDARQVASHAGVVAAFAPIRRIGGDRGWYAYTWLWKIRGGLDLLLGGVGLRRGRRDPEHPAVGDALDFWRVQAYEPDRLLRLVAEMKVPGQAWLEFRVEPEGTGSRIRQTAVFHPSGKLGYLYWYALFPIHQLVFGGMLRRIVELGESPVRLSPSGKVSKERS
jgi:uncharacterized protein YbjT (DUF2867 family)